jgi:hypothetical protein
MAADGSEDKDWRLQAELDVAEPRASLHTLVKRFRGPDVIDEIEAAVPQDVVITHDGNLLFAYAADESQLSTARRAIEDALRHDAIAASVRVSHWDDELDDWRQTDPPATDEQTRVRAAVQERAKTVETRTIVASAGKLIRAEFEQSLHDWSQQLGVECEVIEHPHLLTTQVAFTVTGPKRKVEQFLQGVRAEENATIRAERTVMLSPL